jgi:hypothetical protein
LSPLKIFLLLSDPSCRAPSILIPRNDDFHFDLISELFNFNFSRPSPSLRSRSLLFFLHHNVFARAPMILPGMPFGRPCALAKTPARTRKHCTFSLSPQLTRTSDNVHFQDAFSRRPIPRRSRLDSVYLNFIALLTN